jgi:hypothetical protein
MTWTKTPDDYPDRLIERSDAAYRLHHAATTYSNRVGLDGRIPKARVHLIPVPPRTRRAAVIRELVAAELWQEDADAFTLVDFLRDQPSRQEVDLQRQWDVLRQQIRFAKGPDDADKQARLRRQAGAVRDALQDVRNRRKANIPGGFTSESLVPLRSVSGPLRPAPSEDESETEARRLGALGSAQPPPNEECLKCRGRIGRFQAQVMTERGPMHSSRADCETGEDCGRCNRRIHPDDEVRTYSVGGIGEVRHDPDWSACLHAAKRAGVTLAEREPLRTVS